MNSSGAEQWSFLLPTCEVAVEALDDLRRAKLGGLSAAGRLLDQQAAQPRIPLASEPNAGFCNRRGSLALEVSLSPASELQTPMFRVLYS